MTKQTFQATKSLIKQHTIQLFQSNPTIQCSDNSFNVKPTKMLSNYGGRGLRPDPPSPTSVYFFQLVYVDKEGLLVIGKRMMTDSRNQSPENSKVPFRESESVKENVNRYVGAFYLSHHELLMNEFRRVLN